MLCCYFYLGYITNTENAAGFHYRVQNKHNFKLKTSSLSTSNDTQTFTQKIRQLLITKKDVCNILWNI